MVSIPNLRIYVSLSVVLLNVGKTGFWLRYREIMLVCVLPENAHGGARGRDNNTSLSKNLTVGQE